MTNKETRKRFGLGLKAIEASRVLEKGMNSGDFNGQSAQCLLIVNDRDGTITPGNTYNGNLGSNYQAQPRPLPAPNSDRMKEYLGSRGYSWGKVEDHPALVKIEAKAPASTK